MNCNKVFYQLWKCAVAFAILFQGSFLNAEERYFHLHDSSCFFLSEKLDSSEMSVLKNEPFIAISLGYNCWPASHLQDHALRKRSYPFDWMITSFDGLYHLFETDFYDFLNIAQMGVTENFVTTANNGVQFAHDFYRADWRELAGGIVPLNEAAIKDHAEITSRYERRITRLYQTLELNIPIYFIRWDITKDQAYKLYELLAKKWPKSDIHLACLQTQKENSVDEDWGHPKIKHFSIGIDGQTLAPWENKARNPEWSRVFHSLGLLVSQWNTCD